jgi:thiol-disulfide isomerase/thioredoxin
MERRRRIRVLRIVLAIAVAQGLAVLLYQWIEQTRRAAEEPPFRYERLSGRTARDLVLLRPDGKSRRLAELRGRPVLLHFWATWCAPCKAELPQLLELGDELKRERGFELLAVAVHDDWASIRAFFADRVPDAIHLDPIGEAAKAFEVSVLPDSYVLNAAGAPIARLAGERAWKSLQAHETMRRFATHERR